MIAAGVAVPLSEDEQYWVNENGETVNCSTGVGLKVKVQITHPEWLIFGDEVGTDISQKNDGSVGGQLFITTKGTRGNVKSSHTDGRFTLIGLTAASGDAVMAIMIFTGEELSFEQRMGHDIRVEFDENKTITDNSGPGKTFPGGPTCLFRGKTIPALICCTKKGSITSEILRTALERLDELGVYERTPDRKPMALFDAHDSRLQIPLLRYINNPVTQWIFCIGLPNGTHKWQVGDSNEQNGAYKVEWAREKAILVQYRIRMGLSANLEKSDCLPLVNIVWPRSFGRSSTNSKAIADRGWYPCNRRLLTDPEILKTRTAGTPAPDSTTTITTPLHAPLLTTAANTTDIVPATITTTNAPLLTTATNTTDIAHPTSTTTVATTIATVATIPSTINGSSNTQGSSSTGLTTLATDVVPSPWIDLTDLNFDRGLAGEFTIDILQHIVRKEKVNENLNRRYQIGQATRGNIDTARKLTGGNLFRCKHIVLDKDVLDQREAKEQQKDDDKTKTVQGQIDKYHLYKKAYNDVQESVLQESEYKGKQFKAVIYWKKRDGDKAVPSKVADLKMRYEETKNRDDLDLHAYLTDRGLCKRGGGALKILCLVLWQRWIRNKYFCLKQKIFETSPPVGPPHINVGAMKRLTNRQR